MRSKLFLLCILYSVSLSATPEIQFWKSTKGTRVYFVETHELPIVDVQLLFDAGSNRDTAPKSGLALFTSSLLEEGAGGLNADAISFEFERLGAVFSASAGYDSASASLRSLSDEELLQPALNNLKRVVSMPDFTEKSMERVRKQILVGIQYKQQSPQALASEAFRELIYQDHPYALPNEGTELTIKSISRSDIINFHSTYYVSRNSMLVIVGDITRERAEVIAEELVGGLPKGETAGPFPAVRPLHKAVQTLTEHPSLQTHILVGQPGIKRNDPDYFPIYVGNHVLGGSGLVSRLFKEIREKRGLSYSAYSYFSPRREAGPFTSGLQTRADQAQEALQVLKENLTRFVANGPSQEELDAAKQNITGGFPMRIDSNSKIMGYTAVIGFYNLPLDYLDKFNANVEAVTIEAIKMAFQRHLNPETMATVMVGPLSDQKAETQN